MRLWHVLVICILAGLWFNRGDLGIDRFLREHGIPIPMQAPKLEKQTIIPTKAYSETVREVLPHFTVRAVKLSGMPNSFITDSTGTLRTRINGGLNSSTEPHVIAVIQQLIAGQ